MKEAYTGCINNPACDGCKTILKKSLPTLIRENVIKEGEIGVNDGSNFKEKGWHHTLTLLEGDNIITKRTKDELVTINGTVNGYVGGKRWYGGSVMRYRPTGLYAAPGDMVTVTFPEKLLGKIGINIGHYEYKIWFPEMQKSVFKIGSPWGGLIVLWLTKKDSIKGEFTIKVDNAIKAPTYILGKSTNEEWNNEIKHYSPKWAVLRVPGQANIYVQTLKIKDITDMEGQMTKIKKSMDVLEKMIDLPEGSQPGAEVILFYPGMGGGYHGGGICATGTAVCGDSLYPLKKGKKDTYYDDFFKTLGYNGLVGHELGHGFCYSDTPNMGNQWTAEYVAQYQRWRMRNPDAHSLKKSWWMNSTNLDFYLLDRMVSFSLYSDGKPCGEAKFANKQQLYEGAYDKCWKWLHWIPQRLHGWDTWEKFNALDAKSKTKYPKRGNMKDYLEGWMFRQDLNAHDRMVDLYCQATGHNMLPLFDWYNMNNNLNPKVINNCTQLPESNLLTEWLNVAECVKQSMNGKKKITDCQDMPRFPPHEGLCLLNGVCRKDPANGGTTQMENRFDLKGTYKSYDRTSHTEESCLKRAGVFFKDCENEDSQTVTATFLTKDGNSKQMECPHDYEGNCYNDRGGRLMPKYKGSSSTMTPEVCNKICLADHYKYFGVQYSWECWCGNEAPRVSRKVELNECDDMCSGDRTRRCGGSYRANIWKVCPGHHCLFPYVTSSTCPEGHTSFGKHCYFPSFKDGGEAVGFKSWLDARDYCRELSKEYPTYKYDLVSLQNEDEYNFILNTEWSEIYKKWKEQFGIWIGLNDRDEEGKWTWSDGAPLDYGNPSPTAQTPPWKRGEPKQYGNEDCVRTYGLKGWTDRDCNIEMNFICEGQKESGEN